MLNKLNSKDLRLIGLFLFGMTWLSANSPITVFSAEVGSSRRLIVSLGDARPVSPDWVNFSTDSATGRFSLTFHDLSTNDYQGRTHFLERGVIPIQVSVAQSDSQSLMITGKTLPFKKAWGFWVLEQNEFIVDFFQEAPPETIFHEKTLTPGVPRVASIQKKQMSGLIKSVNTERHLFLLFKRAVLYSGLVLIFVVALIFGLRKKPVIFRKKKKSSSTEEMESTKSESTTPDNDAVRQVMEKTGQTWDEAALTLSMGKMKDYGRV